MIRSIVDKLHTTHLPYCWIYVFPGAAILALEVTFEKTYLTRLYGTQMIGQAFSYVFPPAVLICVACVYLCYLWLALLGIALVLARSLPSKAGATRIALTISVLLLERIPVNAWQEMLNHVLGQPGGL